MADDKNPQLDSLIKALQDQNDKQQAAANEAKYQRELSLALNNDNSNIEDETRKGIEELIDVFSF